MPRPLPITNLNGRPDIADFEGAEEIDLGAYFDCSTVVQPAKSYHVRGIGITSGGRYFALGFYANGPIEFMRGMLRDILQWDIVELTPIEAKHMALKAQKELPEASRLDAIEPTRNSTVAGQPQRAQPKVPRGDLDTRATAEFIKNPKLTYRQLAEILGCSAGSLKNQRNLPDFHKARNAWNARRGRYRRADVVSDADDRCD